MKKIYLDAAANTPIDKKVLKAMKPYLSQEFVGNAHAVHDFGINAKLAIEQARSQVKNLFNVDNSEVYFCSGATEANNWVIMGLGLNELKKQKGKRHIVCSAIEHDSVLQPCKKLQELGFEITYIHPNSNGRFTVAQFRDAIRSDTLLVCCMAINNELGTAYNVDRMASVAKKKGALFLCDCTQLISYGGKYLDVRVLFPHIDYFTFSGHKIYSPTGVGCLIARKDVPLYPYMIGGGQEDGFRAGTHNTAGIVGIGKACELLMKQDYSSLYEDLYYSFITLLNKNHIPYTLNIKKLQGIDHFNIISIRFEEIGKKYPDSTVANMLALSGIATSAGSACDTDHIGVYNPSHVLSELKLNELQIKSTVRVSFDKFTTHKDLQKAVAEIKKLWKGE